MKCEEKITETKLDPMKIKYQGQEYTYKELSGKLNISQNNLYNRVRSGWSEEDWTKSIHDFSNKKERVIPLCGFNNIKSLCNFLGISRQRLFMIYHKQGLDVILKRIEVNNSLIN